MKVLRYGLFVSLMLCVCLQTSAARAEPSFAITDVRLFDGVALHPQATVLVRGETIAAVYLGERPPLPRGVKKIRGQGYTLLPGLIDAHTHVWEEARLADSLPFGVTTVLDMAFPVPAKANAMQTLRGKPEYSHYSDYYSAVVSPTTPGGHGTEPEIGLEFPTIKYPEEAEAFIADRVAEGSDYIKITLETGTPFRPFTWVPPATLKAMIDASHKHGKLVVTHITDPDIALFAIESGMDGIVHIWEPRLNGGARPDVAAAARRRGVFFVPTMTVYEHMYDTGGAASLLADPDLMARLSEAGKANLRAEYPPEVKRDRVLLNPSDTGAGAFATMQAAVRSLHEAGVNILVGVDAANLGTWYGISMHREMQLLVEIGMTPLEVLHGATAAAADAFRLTDRGHIAPGYRADMILVEGDPTADILKTRKLHTIWKAGIRLEHTTPGD